MRFVPCHTFSFNRFATIGVLLGLLCGAPDTRAEWVAGLTTDTDTNGIGGVVEYHWQEFATAGGFTGNIAVAGRLDEDGDAWAGAGIAGKYQIGGRFFLEGSFMPGFIMQEIPNSGALFTFARSLGRALTSMKIWLSR